MAIPSTMRGGGLPRNATTGHALQAIPSQFAIPLSRHRDFYVEPDFKMALRDFEDIADHRDPADITEKSEQAEPIENADRTDPMEPIERAEPIEQMDKKEPRDPIDNTESSDHRDHREVPGFDAIPYLALCERQTSH
jgi:hypothetical protein